MSRQKKDHEEHVVPLHSVTETAPAPAPEPVPAPKPAGNGPKGNKPTGIDCQAYDRLATEVHRLQELTGCAGWKQFFGSLMREADEARTQLEFAEKPRDVVKLQATIALVKSQKKKLQQPVEDLNGMRGKWPLFTGEMPWRADFDDLTGRVTMVWVGEGEAPGDFAQSLIKPGAATDAPPEPDEPAAPAAPAAVVAGDTTGEDPDDGEENLDPLGEEPEEDDPFAEA